MIILDTNVVSELMRRQPDSSVVRWLDQQATQSIWITTITLFETRLGLALLPVGPRREGMKQAFAQMLAQDLENRVLPFDTEAASQAALLAAEWQRGGRPVDMRDTQIAGIAQARRARLATRNLHHFEGLTVEVINPWA